MGSFLIFCGMVESITSGSPFPMLLMCLLSGLLFGGGGGTNRCKNDDDRHGRSKRS